MKRTTLLIVTIQLLVPTAFSQIKLDRISVSAGRAVFGTGDVLGIGASVGYFIKKKERKRIVFGTELIFETGNKRPVVVNPSPGEFLNFFYSTTNLVLYPSVSFYPLKVKALRGLGIRVGPSLGYTWQSTEFRAERIYEPGLQIYFRHSYLSYLNAYLIGYRVSVGYHYQFKRKFDVGARMDFSSHTNGDINGLIGLNFGLTL